MNSSECITVRLKDDLRWMRDVRGNKPPASMDGQDR